MGTMHVCATPTAGVASSGFVTYATVQPLSEHWFGCQECGRLIRGNAENRCPRMFNDEPICSKCMDLKKVTVEIDE